jgi:2-amino-4-hydroxy-6-hydroxymethyldihydropteridine diphosphokinase
VADPVEAFVAVGSNIEPERNIAAALDMLMECVAVTGVSTFYRTAPLGRPEQDPFLNGVWSIETSAGARNLKFAVLRRIEAELGRLRTADRYAPRTIDLDVAVYGREAIDEPDLVVPDPDIAVRPFLAVPLAELAPGLELPGTGIRVGDLPAASATEGLEAVPEFTGRLRRRAAR